MEIPTDDWSGGFALHDEPATEDEATFFWAAGMKVPHAHVARRYQRTDGPRARRPVELRGTFGCRDGKMTQAGARRLFNAVVGLIEQYSSKEDWAAFLASLRTALDQVPGTPRC